MEELIIITIQGIIEFILEVLSYDIVTWWPSPTSQPSKPMVRSVSCLLFLFPGCFLAWYSVLIFKHTFIQLPALRIANLVLAPITSAFISQEIARRFLKKNPETLPRNSFWRSFWFTLGLVSVRFVYASRT